jgi:death-on-curing protein
MSEIFFLETSDVLKMHQKMIQLFGGTFGVREMGLLESAVDMPKASFGDQFLHETIFDKAAAYLFHIAKNHAFVDGNKRTAYVAMQTFLRMNGYRLVADEHEREQLAVDTATSQLDKKQIAALLDSWSEKI